ncbi:YtcA family lipoprotein [Granulicella arctica]|uniref:YtcA family lipoprotein n=1 Tax=Granulicella arctica TaxID=940613 RepID=UPI0021E01228|nr:YtcA family lipoprotein [Granulicella arctica]
MIHSAHSRRSLSLSSFIMFVPALTGCAQNPSFSILGSYFPSWAFCIVVASFLTLLLRWILRRLDWEHQLAPLVVVYPSLALLLCLSLWLVLFGVR